MKITLLLTALLLAAGSVASAQTKLPAQPNANEILSLVQSFYDQTKSISATFVQERYTKAYDQKDRAKGDVVFQKPGKMRWDYREPTAQVYLATANRLVIYQASEKKGEPGQISEQKLSDDDLPAVFAFLTGRGSLNENFSAQILSRPDKNSLYILKLVPTTATPQFAQLLFGVQLLEKDGKRAALVKRVVIVDHAGNWNQFDFNHIKFNAKVSPKHFSFEAPKGTRKIKAISP